MIKKIYLIIFLTLLVASCGKKGDPVYKGQKLKIFKDKTSKIL